MAADIRPPAYIPQGTFSGYIPPQSNIERRRRLADVLAMQGMDTSPVQSPWQALARVAQAGAGAYGNYQAGQMEQQRFKALGEAMRGGMTPEQAFATGDPQLMQYGEFAAQMAQHRLEADRQAEMLRLAQEESRRQGVTLAQNAPGNREAASEAARLQHEKIVRGEAASRFMDKLNRIYGSIGVTVDPKTGQPDYSKAREDLFGQFQGGPGGSLAGNIASAVGMDSSEPARQQLETDLQSAAQDYATMSGIDPQLARRYLPALTVPDVRTAFGGLQSAATNAQRYIDEAGGGVAPGPVDRATLPPPAAGPRHPFQGAPGPRVDARAGEVPLPAQAGPSALPQPGGLPYEPDPRYPNLTPEVWATWPLERQQDWKMNK